MAFWKFTGATAETFPAIGLTAKPGLVYDFGNNAPPADPLPTDSEPYPLPLSKWASDPGPATDYSIRQASDVVTTKVRRNLALTDYAKLTPWYAALANRNAARANVVVMGASIVEGGPTSLFSRNVAAAMATLLRARFPTPGVTGGRGYIGTPTTNVVAFGWPLVFTGGTFDDTTFNYGAKHRVWYTNAAATKVVDTLTAPVTSFDINHIAGTGGAATTGYYKIDGGAAVTFNTFNAGTAFTKLHVASPANTTIEVGWNAAGFLIFEGITEYNGDENAGIQVHNCGHTSYSAANWNVGASAASWVTSIANLNPSLLIMQDFGVNDAWTGNGNLTGAQFQASLLSLIASLRTFGVTCPILLAADYDTSGGLTLNQPWPNYVSAMQAVADADPTIAFVDHSARMPSTASANTYGLYHTDLVHGNANGNAYHFMAETLVDAISPR